MAVAFNSKKCVRIFIACMNYILHPKTPRDVLKKEKREPCNQLTGMIYRIEFFNRITHRNATINIMI
jgi:hypothetical protein